MDKNTQSTPDSTTTTPPTLQQRLALLLENGADRFNPVHFRYIESMAQHAAKRPQAAARVIETKAINALSDYQVEFAQAKEDAAERTERIAASFPDCADRIKSLFADNDFKAIKRLEHQLSATQKWSDQCPDTLASLTQRLIQDESLFDKNIVQNSFDDVLHRQETDLIQSITNTTAATTITPPTELKSIRLFRKSWTKLRTDNEVQQAIKGGPKNPGPLNQDMLATRTISTMRDLSPQYLNRLISYLETVFWLEQAGAPEQTAQSKKNGGTGKKKKTRRKKK